MPYRDANDPKLPDAVKKLAKKLRQLWVKVFNETLGRYGDEARAFATAWAAVRRAHGGEDMSKEEKAKKTEDGVQYPASAFLHVPDPDKPSTWSLRVRDENGNIDRRQLGQVAAALGPKGFRGNRAEVTEEERRKYARKLISLYREIDVPDGDIPEYLWEIAGMKKPVKKAINLRATLADVESALPTAFPGLDIVPIEVFDDHVIVRLYEPGGGSLNSSSKYYKVPYRATYKQVEGDPNETEVIESISFAPREEWRQVIPTYTALKFYEQEDGRTRWLSISSGGFEDKEGEIVSTELLQSAVKAADETGERGPLLVFHIPGSDIGVCDFQAVVGGFLLESGTFADTPAGRAAAKYLKEHADEYGVSIKFLYGKRTRDGVYEPPGVILERSVLPKDAAAFPWSAIKLEELEEKMFINERKKKELVKIVGEEAAEQILVELEQNTRTLKEMGVRFKEHAQDQDGTQGQDDVQDQDDGDRPESFEVLLSDETLAAIAEEVTARLTGELKALKDATQMIAEVAKELAKSEEERIAEKVGHLPRATVRRIRRPTRDNPPGEGGDEREKEQQESRSFAELAEIALGFKEG